MKRYKLLKDLPTFKAGTEFFINKFGCLCTKDAESGGTIIAYAKATLEKFPGIIEDWFEGFEETDGRSYGQPYWLIENSGVIEIDVEENTEIDDVRFGMGNYFKTKEEAERALAKMKAYATVKRDAKGFKPALEGQILSDKYAWCIHCDHYNRRLRYCITHRYAEAGVVYFETEKDAEASLKNHREEWELLFDLDLEEKCEK